MHCFTIKEKSAYDQASKNTKRARAATLARLRGKNQERQAQSNHSAAHAPSGHAHRGSCSCKGVRRTCNGWQRAR